MDQSIEQWQPVPGYTGIYEVSDQGRLRSLDRIDHRGYRRPGRFVPGSPTHGYLRVRLTDQVGRHRSFGVHALVLAAFVGPRPADYEGCHNDGNPSNNALSNLRWDSRSENQKDRARHGTDPQLRRSACPRGHALTAPNLSSRHAKLSKRACRACDREWAEAKRQARSFSPANADAIHERLLHGWTPTPMRERTECVRGHKLIGGNLRKAALEKRGQRSCRACGVEMSAARRHGRPFDLALADARARGYLSD